MIENRRRRRSRGFTLVEAIVAITLMGILGGMVAVFIRAPIQAYFDSSERAVLTDAADAAIRRISRDVQSALPNSFRGPDPASTSCFEFLPAVAGGRYRVEKSAPPAPVGDILRFTGNDDGFDALVHRGLNASMGTGSHLAVVYNLGILGADAYAGDNTKAITGITFAPPGGAEANIATSNTQFPFESPNNRFQVIPNYAVVYSCSGTSLLRTTRAISPTRLAACPGTGQVLAANVDCAASRFEYEPAVTQRNGMLMISLKLNGAEGESVRLHSQVSVSNVP